MYLLGRFLHGFITAGNIGVIDANGKFHGFGALAPGGQPDVIVALHDRSLHWKLAIRPDLYLGEAYMDGSLEITRGSLWDFLQLQLARRQDAVPLTRDYIFEFERARSASSGKLRECAA